VVTDKKVFETKIFISGAHPHFDGHFPITSVFPGVSQIDLVMNSARQQWDGDFRCAMVKRAKYRAILLPDSEVSLTITLQNDFDLSWILRDERQIFSTGDLRLKRNLKASTL
jgi:3-hydroxymyristoyl/3-hydroxydecanoyl-(acyl carrier protein) dehydratase